MNSEVVLLLYRGIISLLTWITRDYQITMQVLSGILILSPLPLHFVPESPRWLLSTRQPSKVNEARSILEEAAKVNGRPIVDQELIINQATRDSYKNMFTSKVLLKRTMILSFNWFVVKLMAFGLAFNIKELTGFIFLNFAAMGCLQTLSKLVVSWLVLKAGRRLPYMSLVFAAGTVLLITLAFPKGLYYKNWPLAALAVLGSLCITMALSIQLVYTAELYPTPLRNSGFGICSSMGYVATIASVSIGSLSRQSEEAPAILFGALAFLAVFSTLFLPETNGDLPKSLDDIKCRIKSGKDRSLFSDIIEAIAERGRKIYVTQF